MGSEIILKYICTMVVLQTFGLLGVFNCINTELLEIRGTVGVDKTRQYK